MPSIVSERENGKITERKNSHFAMCCTHGYRPPPVNEAFLSNNTRATQRRLHEAVVVEWMGFRLRGGMGGMHGIDPCVGSAGCMLVLRVWTVTMQSTCLLCVNLAD